MPGVPIRQTRSTSHNGLSIPSIFYAMKVVERLLLCLSGHCFAVLYFCADSAGKGMQNRQGVYNPAWSRNDQAMRGSWRDGAPDPAATLTNRHTPNLARLAWCRDSRARARRSSDLVTQRQLFCQPEGAEHLLDGLLTPCVSDVLSSSHHEDGVANGCA
jgi:hypothetical protein